MMFFFFNYLFDTCQFIRGFFFVISLIEVAGGQSTETLVGFLFILIAQHDISYKIRQIKIKSLLVTEWEHFQHLHT